MIISIDHGNKQIKTTNKVFISGIISSVTKPPFGDVLRYNGKYYGLCSQRLPHMKDKTDNDDFFILTLFAIGFEILETYGKSNSFCQDIDLLVGLPPAHYGAQYKAFEQYFSKRDPRILFELNGVSFSIHINSVFASPQAYAASMLVFGQLKTTPRANVIDIGGYTADGLLVENGKANLTMCDSLPLGTIVLSNQICKKIRAEYCEDLSEIVIEAMISENTSEMKGYPTEMIEKVQQYTHEFVDGLIKSFDETGLDLYRDKTVFVGGGPMLLKKYIEHSGKVGNAIFIDDILANVKGYKTLHQAYLSSRS